MARKPKKWIAGAVGKPGALRRQLGVKAGEKIPAKKLAAARAGRHGPLAEKRAHLAKTLASFEQGGEVPKTGTYRLHKGETVVPAQNKAYDRRGNNCAVLGDGADGQTCDQLSPMDIARREYGAKRAADLGLDPEREKAAAEARREDDGEL